MVRKHKRAGNLGIAKQQSGSNFEASRHTNSLTPSREPSHSSGGKMDLITVAETLQASSGTPPPQLQHTPIASNSSASASGAPLASEAYHTVTEFPGPNPQKIDNERRGTRDGSRSSRDSTSRDSPGMGQPSAPRSGPSDSLAWSTLNVTSGGRTGSREGTGSASWSPGAMAGMSSHSSIRSKIQAAVATMQGDMREELQDGELKLSRLLGEGGFGSVYQGAQRTAPAMHAV
jgi:hypothetical protein